MQLIKVTWQQASRQGMTLAALLMGGTREIVQIGTLVDIVAYAQEHGLKFKSNTNMMYGGYYVDSEGNAYIPWANGGLL